MYYFQISPCVDVPLASVQIERTDSLEMIPNTRNQADFQKQKSGPRSIIPKSKVSDIKHDSDAGYSSGLLSSSNGNIKGVNSEYTKPLLQTQDSNSSEQETQGMQAGSAVSSYDERKSDIYDSYARSHLEDLVGSYVPSGYIMLDHDIVSGDTASNFYKEVGTSSV